MNKKGLSTGGVVALVLLVVLVVAVIGGGSYWLASQNAKQSAVGANAQTSNVSAGSSSVSCGGSNPAFSPIASDAITNGVISSSVNKYLYTQVGSSAPQQLSTLPTTLAVGDSVIGLVNASGYIPAVITTSSVKCGGNNPPIQLYAYANASITIHDDSNGIPNALTQGSNGGVYNGTAPVAGGSATYGITLKGTNQKSTSNVVIVVESPASTNTNISSIIVTCAGSKPFTMPTALGNTNTGSIRTAVEIPAIVNTNSNICSVTVQTVATKTASGAYLVKYYAIKPYFASDNSIQTDSIVDTTPNGNNANEYEDSYTSNFVVQ